MIKSKLRSKITKIRENYSKNSVVEIMTGGLVPKPFDSILAVEKAKYFPTKEKPTHIIINKEVKKF